MNKANGSMMYGIMNMRKAGVTEISNIKETDHQCQITEGGTAALFFNAC